MTNRLTSSIHITTHLHNSLSSKTDQKKKTRCVYWDIINKDIFKFSQVNKKLCHDTRLMTFLRQCNEAVKWHGVKTSILTLRPTNRYGNLITSHFHILSWKSSTHIADYKNPEQTVSVPITKRKQHHQQNC